MATATLPIVRDKLFIGGDWVEPAGRAVRAARAAFDSWSQASPYDRARYCEAIAAALDQRADELAALITTELGMPIELSRMIQVGLPSMTFASMPELVEELAWEEEVGNSLIVREPAGVVAAITPWNYPLHQIANKVAPALAAGCTVVLKPSEVVPLNAFVLAEVVEEVGLPAGVFNLVTGTGPVVGEAIVSHPETDMVSFTGSTRAGRRVSELAARAPKPVTLELGGKSPNVILDDADLEEAVTDGMAKCYLNSGQTCSALTRMLVPRDKLEQAERLAATIAEEAFRPGDPFQDGRRLRAARGSRARLLRAPDGLLRRDQRHDDRPGGDLRPRAGPDPVRGRGGRGPDRQRQRLRPRRRGVVRRRGARQARGRPDPHRAGRDQRRRLQPDGALRRLQAVRPRPRDGPARPRGVPRGEIASVVRAWRGARRASRLC